MESISQVLLNLVAAIAILLVGIIIGALVQKLIKKILHELEIDKVLKGQGINLPVEDFFSSVGKYAVYFIAVIWALSELGLATTVLHIILFTLLIILVIFVVLAFKDFIPNITAGLFIHQKNLLSEGEVVKIGSVEGKIVKIELTDTKIKAKNGDIILVPNSLITKSKIVKKR